MLEEKFNTVNKSDTVLMKRSVDIRTVELSKECLVHEETVVRVTFASANQHVQLVYHLQVLGEYWGRQDSI